MVEWIFLLVLAGAVAFWYDSLRARERALEVAPAACERRGLQFLDESVYCVSVRPGRGTDGRFALRRVYRFEFADGGPCRRDGSVVLLGTEVESITMDPYLLR